MFTRVSILCCVMASIASFGSDLMAGSAIPISVNLTRHPEPKRRVNWAAVNAASQQIDVAKSQLRQAAQTARREVEATEEFESAITALRSARSAYQMAVTEATSSLEHSAQYIALDLRLQAAVSELEQMRRSQQTKPEHVVAAAGDVMQLRARMTELRKAALTADENVEAAKYALIDAGMALRRLRDDAKSRVTQSGAWQSARQQLDAARRQYASAG